MRLLQYRLFLQRKTVFHLDNIVIAIYNIHKSAFETFINNSDLRTAKTLEVNTDV